MRIRVSLSYMKPCLNPYLQRRPRFNFQHQLKKTNQQKGRVQGYPQCVTNIKAHLQVICSLMESVLKKSAISYLVLILQISHTEENTPFASSPLALPHMWKNMQIGEASRELGGEAVVGNNVYGNMCLCTQRSILVTRDKLLPINNLELT